MPNGPIWRYGAKMRLNEVEGFLLDRDARTDFPRPTPVGELNGLTPGKSGCKGEVIVLLHAAISIRLGIMARSLMSAMGGKQT